jgi:uncharacterized protein with HEPN domain
MKSRTNVDHLQDMIHYAERAIRHVGGLSKSELEADELRMDATARAVEVVGEACKRVAAEIKSRFPEVPWGNMARTRDKLIHYYEGVDWEIVWKIATFHIPDALPKLRSIREILLAEEPPPPEIPADDR